MMKDRHPDRADLRGRPGTRWRAALKSLAMPAMRVHNYRNLHKTMFYDAVGQLDCRDDQ